MSTDLFTELLGRAQAGDPDAFAELFRRVQPALLRYLRTLCPDDSDDIASLTWLSVVRGLGGFSGDEGAFRGWLFTVARHAMIDARRASGRRPAAAVGEHIEVLADTTAPDTADIVLERAATVAALEAVASLPPDQAEAVLLRVVAGLDVARIAAIMGRSPGSVRVLTHRGLRALAQRMTHAGSTRS